jgi:hypothetical protein
MASATTPDGIVYPDASDPVAPLNTVFRDLADSVQAALDNQPAASGTGSFATNFMLMGA